jgi:hypothetical protein
MSTVCQDAGKDSVANRRTISDFAIAPSKCVSVMALHQDDPISALHNEAVRQTMLELEKFAEIRAERKARDQEHRGGLGQTWTSSYPTTSSSAPRKTIRRAGVTSASAKQV